MALITTPGAANADSYASLAEADAYNAAILNASTWFDLEDADKERALRLATILLDAMPQAWTGVAASATQELGWPRVGMFNRNGFAIDPTVNPQRLKDAESDFARRLAEEDRTGDNDALNRRIKQVRAGSVWVEFQKEQTTPQIVADTPAGEPAVILMVPDFVRGMLVPSWLKPTVAQENAAAKGSIIIKNLGYCG